MFKIDQMAAILNFCIYHPSPPIFPPCLKTMIQNLFLPSGDLITDHKTSHLLHYTFAIKLWLHNTEIKIKSSPLTSRVILCIWNSCFNVSILFIDQNYLVSVIHTVLTMNTPGVKILLQEFEVFNNINYNFFNLY